MMTKDIDPRAPWAHRVALVDEALAAGTMSQAFYEWHEAHGEAFRSGRWEALLAVGEAAARIDAAAGSGVDFRADARRVFLAALVRARAEESAAGVRQIAAAFAKLGDHELAERAYRVAQDLC
jgi:hypothetical protein